MTDNKDIINQEARTIYTILREAKDKTEIGDFHGMFGDVETLISSLAFLITPLLEREMAYRQVIVREMANGAPNTKAEAIARASREYLDWKKLQMIYDLAEEQIKILKRFRGLIEQEFQRT